ncbi:hypothetical protein MKW92_009037, partial [Papaver armeniacum]
AHRLTSKKHSGEPRRECLVRKKEIMIILLLRHLCSQGSQLQLRILDQNLFYRRWIQNVYIGDFQEALV